MIRCDPVTVASASIPSPHPDRVETDHADVQALLDQVNRREEAIEDKPYKLHGAFLSLRLLQSMMPRPLTHTFLCFEKHILWMHERIAELTMHYNPRIIVHRIEDALADSMNADTRQKIICVLGNYVYLFKVLQKYVS